MFRLGSSDWPVTLAIQTGDRQRCRPSSALRFCRAEDVHPHPSPSPRWALPRSVSTSIREGKVALTSVGLPVRSPAL